MRRVPFRLAIAPPVSRTLPVLTPQHTTSPPRRRQRLARGSEPSPFLPSPRIPDRLTGLTPKELGVGLGFLMQISIKVPSSSSFIPLIEPSGRIVALATPPRTNQTHSANSRCSSGFDSTRRFKLFSARLRIIDFPRSFRTRRFTGAPPPIRSNGRGERREHGGNC